MTQPMAPDLVRHLQSVGDPALSPDGSLLAFVHSRIDPETLQSQSRIRLLNLGILSRRRLTLRLSPTLPPAPGMDYPVFLRMAGRLPFCAARPAAPSSCG